MPQIVDILRYPVKGLNGQRLDTVTVSPGGYIENDRAFAVAHGQTDFDPEAPVHMSKTRFLALMTHPKMAALQATFDEKGSHMTLRTKEAVLFEADLASEAGRADAGAFFDDFMGDQAKGTPKVVTAENHMFSDVKEKCLSVLNLASVEALSNHIGEELDPLRFRANLHIEGLEPWQERDWPKGMTFYLGGVRVTLLKPIVRCAATNVNLETAECDQNLPKTLMQNFGANLMGVYAVVEEAGTITVGDTLRVESA